MIALLMKIFSIFLDYTWVSLRHGYLPWVFNSHKFKTIYQAQYKLESFFHDF